MEIIIKRSKEYWDNSFKKGRWDRLLDKEREKNTSFIAELICTRSCGGKTDEVLMRLSIALDSVIKFEMADSCLSNEKPARVEMVSPKINAVIFNHQP